MNKMYRFMVILIVKISEMGKSSKGFLGDLYSCVLSFLFLSLPFSAIMMPRRQLVQGVLRLMGQPLGSGGCFNVTD